jgi:hypothetical protein
VLRFLLWRMLAAGATLVALAACLWLLSGAAGRALRSGGERAHASFSLAALCDQLAQALSSLRPRGAVLLPAWLGLAAAAACMTALALARMRARRERRYVRLRLEPYLGDAPDEHALARMYSTLHAALTPRWWRRLLRGAPSISLEAHHAAALGTTARAWLAVSLPDELEAIVQAALRCAYPNCRLEPSETTPAGARSLVRLKKRGEFIGRTWTGDRYERDPEPTMNRIINAMSACAAPALVQLALTPAPVSFERVAKHLYRRHEAHVSRVRREHLIGRDRSLLDEAYLRGGLEIQYGPLFFADLRVVAPTQADCERIAAPLRAQRAENRFVERRTSLRHRRLDLYSARIERGQGNPLPDLSRGVLAAPELVGLWQVPSVDYATVPFARSAVPLAPAPPAIERPAQGAGTLRDCHGPV